MQTSPRPVVVGVDGSEGSRRAARLGVQEARRRGAPLRLLLALPSPYRGVVTVAPEPGLAAELHSNATEVLQAVAADVAGDAPEVDVTWSVVEGRPGEVLRDASVEAQLVVLGSRGAGGVAGLVLGSTANGVVNAAACPVIVLPDRTTLSVSGRRSVVAGVAGRSGDEELLTFAFDQAAAAGTDLLAVHALQETVLDPAELAVGPLIDWAAVLDDEERGLAETLAGWRDKHPDVVVRELVVRDKTARGLLAAALTAQLLVVGHRRRHRMATLGSTTHGVLHRATCPVAVVPLDAHREA
jgi:nucleotide-binding universal stress UspA family protein